jgi:hypothetical protein
MLTLRIRLSAGRGVPSRTHCGRNTKVRNVTENGQSASIAGAAFLAVVVSTVASFLVVNATVEAPKMLLSVVENETQLRLGISLDLVSSVGILVLSVPLYSVLKQESEPIALLGLCFWIAESILLAASKVNLFALVTLSLESVRAETSDPERFRMLGTVLLEASRWGYNTLLLFFALGGLAFYYLLYRSRLVPQFLSVWGLVAVVMVLIGFLSRALGAGAGAVLFGPAVLFEIAIGVWLLVKGFSPPVVDSLGGD